MAIAVSDGSFKDKWGISALVIEVISHNVHIIIVTSTNPGRSKSQETYQSELAGIYHIILIMEDIFS